MLRCIAVDDEAFATRLLASYIQKLPGLVLAGTTTNPLEALQWVQEGRADLVFLDIQMPELTGLQFLKICGHRCKVILTTAYPEYALEGYEHDVVDYLLKPIAFDRFVRAVQKAQALLPAAAPVALPPVPAPSAPVAAPTPDYLFVKGDSKNKYLKLNYADILYIQGLKNYVSIVVPGQRIITYLTLRELAEQLPQPPFVRVHKSYIISLDHLRLVDGHSLYIGQEEITVGETYRDEFFKLIREKG
ncbi:response regulator transcription factor [Hymenobacter sp. UV11]|uniref:LytR/AlgR family response regulator transcription factor n=1 Tax=Hymenobacter sp. UV11 TaxID=1849735 RepID=UPI00105E8F98|nr:LytTR family DNA-binding domain-containing protein [Hymenobacter sp. UV11]TDN39789.1 DNA-binding response regulator [Hymenobacter sp. UV11]TFZ67088.1 response regulator transcription factor [Hymenobacter sp. UV11]